MKIEPTASPTVFRVWDRLSAAAAAVVAAVVVVVVVVALHNLERRQSALAFGCMRVRLQVRGKRHLPELGLKRDTEKIEIKKKMHFSESVVFACLQRLAAK